MKSLSLRLFAAALGCLLAFPAVAHSQEVPVEQPAATAPAVPSAVVPAPAVPASATAAPTAPPAEVPVNAPVGVPSPATAVPVDLAVSPAPAAPVSNANPAQQPAPGQQPAPVQPQEAVPVVEAIDTTVNPHPPIVNGKTVELTMEHEGKPRRYLVRIPDAYDPARAVAVLFGFGGWEDSPENFSSYARMWTTDAHRDAIIVYPEGFERAWEAAPYAKTRDGEDIRFIQRILDAIDVDYHVDRARVYAMGMSNGGGFTSVLGCHAQETFAAVAMVSGAFYNPVEIGCKDEPMATLIMHGTNDRMMTYDGGDRHAAGYLPVRTVLGGYLNRNRCDMTFQQYDEPSGAQRLVFNGCQREVELLKVNADHTWFWAPDAAGEVWNFLSRQHK